MNVAILTPVGRELSTDHQRCIDVLRERQPDMLVLREYGITCVDQARAILFDRGLKSGADVLLWIDDDIVFDPDDVAKVSERCLSGSYDVLAVAYARRLPGGGMNIQLEDSATEIQFFKPGFFPAKNVGLGFTAIRRPAALTLAETCPRARMGVIRSGKPDLIEVTTMFASRIVDGLWLADDESFCGYVRDAGFKIGVDLEPRIWHRGSYLYGLEDSALTVTRVSALSVTFKPPPGGTS